MGGASRRDFQTLQAHSKFSLRHVTDHVILEHHVNVTKKFFSPKICYRLQVLKVPSGIHEQLPGEARDGQRLRHAFVSLKKVPSGNTYARAPLHLRVDVEGVEEDLSGLHEGEQLHPLGEAAGPVLVREVQALHAHREAGVAAEGDPPFSGNPGSKHACRGFFFSSFQLNLQAKLPTFHVSLDGHGTFIHKCWKKCWKPGLPRA